MAVIVLMIVRYDDDLTSATSESWVIDEDAAAEIKARHGEPVADALMPTMIDAPADCVVLMR